jgi:hypothetical protein
VQKVWLQGAELSSLFWFFKAYWGDPKKKGVWNQASIGGGVEVSTVDGRWYIQNEVVSGAYGSGNKFGIERIRRFKACRRNSRFAAERRFGRFHAPAFFSMDILLLHHFTSKVKKGLEKQLVKTWLVLCFFPHFPLHHPVGARESNPDPD